MGWEGSNVEHVEHVEQEQKLQFKVYDDSLAERDDVLVVDGVAGNGLNLSHWPGNWTPERFRADTTTEMALLVAAAPDRDEWLKNIKYISNNHFDTDGLLAVWILMHPDEALKHRDALVAAARAGDFETFTTPDGVLADLSISGLAEHPESPLGASDGPLTLDKTQELYEYCLRKMPELIYSAEDYRDLWYDEYDLIKTTQARLKNGEIRIEEHPGVSIVYSLEMVHWMPIYDACQSDRVLAVLGPDTPTNRLFEVRYKPKSWFVTTEPPKQERLPMQPIASQLNNYMPQAGMFKWVTTGERSVNARLYYGMVNGPVVPCPMSTDTVLSVLKKEFKG